MPPQQSLGPEESQVHIFYSQDGQGVPYRLDQTGRSRSPSSWEEDSLQDGNAGHTHSRSSPYRAKRQPVTGYAPVHDEFNDPKNAPKATTDKHSWTMEITTMALCLAAVVTSTVLLFYADGRPLTDYTFFISFNTLISILSAVARATLAFAVGSCLGQWKWNWFSRRSGTPVVFASFEDASRGPWGSFWLICRLRARHWAAIGALVTLLMLGFEPFMQAIIYYEGRLITTALSPTAAPSIGTSPRLDAGSTRPVKTGGLMGFKIGNESYQYPTGQFRREASPGLASAVYRGFYANDPRDAVSFTCSTGNCTWPVFTSLSVCSACNDVSDRVEVRGRNGTDLGNIKVHGFHTEGYYITHSLPYVNITNLAHATNVGMVGRLLQFDEYTVPATYMSATALSNPGMTLTFGELNTMIVAVGLIRADPAYTNHSKPWNQTRSTATECVLYLCTNAYQSRVSGGKLKEDIVASWSNRVPGSYSPKSGESMGTSWSAYEQYTNYSLNTGSAYYSLDDLQLQIPKTEAEKHDLPNDVPLLFNITQNTLGSMLPFLNDFFQDPLVYGESDIGPIISQTLHNSADLSATFAGAATSMSNWIRDNTDGSRAGEQKEWVLHIRVRWPYVTLPLLVVLLGCAFVFLSMWETRRLRLPAWKTDVLATLTHSLDSGTREELRAAALQGRAQERAKGMVLNFEDTGKGLELRAQDQRPSA
ncbi:hypothetical protein PG984_011795 [Apiospora sp. TS-2023a]